MADASVDPVGPADDETGRPRRSLLVRWAVACVAGGLVGMALAAPLYFLTDGPLADAGIALVEGGALGGAQWWVLRRALPGIGGPVWVAATACGAVLAWVIGSALPVADWPGGDPSWFQVVLLTVVLGGVFGTAPSLGQWLVLRRYVAGANRWILASALGWTFGLVVLVLGLALLGDEATAWLAVFVTVLVAGLWHALRRPDRQPEPWVATNVLGWLAGLVVAVAIFGSFGGGPPLVLLILFVALTVAALLSPILATGWVLHAFASESEA